MSSRKSLWSQWTHRSAQAAQATRSDLHLRSHVSMVARPRRPTSHGGCRPESCHEVHKGQDHLQGAHGHRAPPHQVLKGWRNILHPRMGRHHSRLTCAAARARTATCSSAASSTKRLAAQAESGREPARHSLREKCNALHCQRVKRTPAGLEPGTFALEVSWKLEFQELYIPCKSCTLFPPYCLATPRLQKYHPTR